MALATICIDFVAQENKVCHHFHCFPICDGTRCHDLSLYLCVYLHVYPHVYLCVCVPMHVPVCPCMYTCVCTSTSTCVYMHVYLCVYLCLCICVCVPGCVPAPVPMCLHVYLCMYLHVYLCVPACVSTYVNVCVYTHNYFWCHYHFLQAAGGSGSEVSGGPSQRVGVSEEGKMVEGSCHRPGGPTVGSRLVLLTAEQTPVCRSCIPLDGDGPGAHLSPGLSGFVLSPCHLASREPGASIREPLGSSVHSTVNCEWGWSCCQRCTPGAWWAPCQLPTEPREAGLGCFWLGGAPGCLLLGTGVGKLWCIPRPV